MNWKTRLLLIGSLLLCMRLSAQLTDGSIAPDFTANDIFGQPHHLYDALNSGRIVVLAISTTWCCPGYAYHQSHALQDFYTEHGPLGSDLVRVFWVEGDPSTNLNCLYGQPGCNNQTCGDYVTATPYPILNNSNVSLIYAVQSYPTIYIICPNKKTYQAGLLPAGELWAKAHQCPVASGTNNAGIFKHSPGTELPELCGEQGIAPTFSLTNLGAAPLTEATIELKWNNNLRQTLPWSGNLPTYGEVQIAFDAQIVGGAGILSTIITDINSGADDENQSNNIEMADFSLARQFNTSQVLLKIRTDDFGDYSRHAFGAGATSAAPELAQNVGLQLFPNPAADFLNIEIEAPAVAEISGNVFNMFGQICHTFLPEMAQNSSNIWRLPLANWPEGVYFFQINIGAQTVSRTFVVKGE